MERGRGGARFVFSFRWDCFRLVVLSESEFGLFSISCKVSKYKKGKAFHVFGGFFLCVSCCSC